MMAFPMAHRAAMMAAPVMIIAAPMTIVAIMFVTVMVRMMIRVRAGRAGKHHRGGNGGRRRKSQFANVQHNNTSSMDKRIILLIR